MAMKATKMVKEKTGGMRERITQEEREMRMCQRWCPELR
jgi:hypothetical protein